jgi:copper resistance protein C
MHSVRALALTAGFALLGAPAWGHAFLKTASPGVGSSVSQAPSQVVINFTEGVEPRFSTITVQNAQGMRVDTGKPHVVGGDTHLAVDLKPPLPPGTYTVVWHATATDTHKTQGTFHFTVGSK